MSDIPIDQLVIGNEYVFQNKYKSIVIGTFKGVQNIEGNDYYVYQQKGSNTLYRTEISLSKVYEITPTYMFILAAREHKFDTCLEMLNDYPDDIIDINFIQPDTQQNTLIICLKEILKKRTNPIYKTTTVYKLTVSILNKRDAQVSYFITKDEYTNPYILALIIGEPELIQLIKNHPMFNPNYKIGEEQNAFLHLLAKSASSYSTIESITRSIRPQNLDLFENIFGDVNVQNIDGDVPLSICIQKISSLRPYPDRIEIISIESNIKHLLNQVNIEVDAVNNLGVTPLLTTIDAILDVHNSETIAGKRKPEYFIPLIRIFRKLITYRANPTIVDNSGKGIEEYMESLPEEIKEKIEKQIIRYLKKNSNV